MAQFLCDCRLCFSKQQFYRELTEPECDRDLVWLRGGGRRSRSVGRGVEGEEQEQVENISSEQLQQELNTIIANYQQEKERRRQGGGQEHANFIISV